jgi:hypothetical protein
MLSWEIYNAIIVVTFNPFTNKIEKEEKMKKTHLNFSSFSADVKIEATHVKIDRGGGDT